jgi:hypothetical protein
LYRPEFSRQAPYRLPTLTDGQPVTVDHREDSFGFQHTDANLLCYDDTLLLWDHSTDVMQPAHHFGPGWIQVKLLGDPSRFGSDLHTMSGGLCAAMCDEKFYYVFTQCGAEIYVLDQFL